MREPTLVILAAGMGSRFGGLKQITPVDDRGHAIIDYSLYDAYRAGFRRVAFIIKHAIEEDFKAAVGRRMEKYFEVSYVYQELDRLPEGVEVPEGRVKPWGTGHAVLCCTGTVDGPFAVINADDFYGRAAYEALYGFLSQERGPGEHATVAYLLRNTVTEYGSVSRSVCSVKDGLLQEVNERTRVEKRGADAAYTEDGEHWVPLAGDTPVVVNCFGYQNSMLEQLSRRFRPWLEANLAANPLKCEYFLPVITSDVIRDGEGSVAVLPCGELWHGITYPQDVESLYNYLASLRAQGVYPEILLD